MIRRFVCAPQRPGRFSDFPEALVFDWDEDTGDVSGPGADTVRELLRQGEVLAGPHPRCEWPVRSLKDRGDLAAIIGHAWILPPELVDDYPDTSEPSEAGAVEPLH